jgi:hypothetical protein
MIQEEDNIYILNEEVMNGTVTIQILTSGIKAKNFKEAVEKLKNEILKTPVDNVNETDNSFSFSVPQDKEKLHGLHLELWGRIEDKPLKIY